MRYFNISFWLPLIHILLIERPHAPKDQPDQDKSHPASRLFSCFRQDLPPVEICQTIEHMKSRIRSPYASTGYAAKIVVHEHLGVEGLEDEPRFCVFMFHLIASRGALLDVPAGDCGLLRELEAIPAVLAMN